MKKYLLIILLLLCNNPLAAATYKRKIGDKYLTITSPQKTTQGNNVNFLSYSAGQSNVRLQYGKTSIRANSATLETTKNKIYLKGGFYSKYLNNTISGTQLVYNPINNFFDADNVLVKTDKMITEAENFSYYGRKITLKKAHFGINVIKLDLEFDRLDLYPGWVVADGTYLKIFKFPIIYAPKFFKSPLL